MARCPVKKFVYRPEQNPEREDAVWYDLLDMPLRYP